MAHQREIDVQGVRVPALIYGTAWKEDATETLTVQALAAGFRAIDTANQRRHYFEAGVGAAIARSGVSRAALFLQTKFTYARGQDHRLPYDPAASPREQVMQSFASSLEHLRTDYIDSFVLHGPEHGAGISLADREVWQAMSDLAARGLIRLLGISNVTAEQVVALCAMAKETATAHPAFVQNRCYARTGWDRDVRTLCRGEGIVYQGFSLLTANPHVLAHAHVRRVVTRLGVTAAAAVFRFTRDLGILPLTGTRKPEHMRDDLAALDLPSLTDDERRAVEAIG